MATLKSSMIMSRKSNGTDLYFLVKENNKGGDPAARSRTATLLRLHPNHQPQLRAQSILGTSVATDFRGVTGGVYKARERIHRSLLICDY